MNAGQRELEGRLDDLLLRIAMETQEIKELEQQLTDGQILANEALQRELQGVICGLQEYLKRLRQQCCRSQQQVDSLQAENQRLQLHLEDAQSYCKQLEDKARLQTKSMEVQQGELSVLQKEAQALREQQMESNRRQAELEAELLQLREELTWQVTLGQEENLSLQIEVQTLQSYLYQTRTQMDQFTAVQSEPEEKQSPEELDWGKTRPTRTQETLSRSVKQLYGIQQTRTSTQQLQQDHTHTKQAQLTQDQDHIGELEAQLEDLMTQDRTAHVVDQDLDWRLREELQRLRGQLEKCQKRSWLIQQNLELEVEQSRFQLQVVQQERDTLLQQLRSLTDGHQRSLGRLNKKLRQLNRFICDADHMTAEQLRSTAEQLRALNHTVDLLHAQKNVEEPDGNSVHDGHTVDQLQAEPACTWKHTRRLKTGGIKTKTRTRGESIAGEGRWWFVPAELNAPSLASQGTQDSGLGLQYLSSPERGRQWTRPPTRGGYWVYFPLKHIDWKDSSSNEDTPPPPPRPETAVGGSDGSSPLGPSGPVSCSPSGSTALHCNIPEHGDLQGGSCECLHKEAERIQEEKKKLRLNTKKLRYMLRRHRSVMQVCDQVECVEKTLLKRQAELRQTDKLLLEAQSCLHETRDQAARLQHRAEDCATFLLEALLHLRKHREEAEQVRMKRGQEQALREMEQALKSRDEGYQQLCRKTLTAMYRLAEVLSDCQEAQRHLESLTCQQEQKLVQRREEELRKEEQRLRAELSSHRAGGEEELRRGREERRSLQEQCRHLET